MAVTSTAFGIYIFSLYCSLGYLSYFWISKKAENGAFSSFLLYFCCALDLLGDCFIILTVT